MCDIQTLTLERDRLAAAVDEAHRQVSEARALLTARTRQLRQAEKAMHAAMNRLSNALEDCTNGR